jgi:comEA protein
MKNSLTKVWVLGFILAFVAITVVSPLAWADATTSGNKININTASAVELQKLPRVGLKIAQRIIEFREKQGKFKRIEELMKVKGIGEKTFKNLKDRITVGTEEK